MVVAGTQIVTQLKQKETSLDFEQPGLSVKCDSALLYTGPIWRAKNKHRTDKKFTGKFFLRVPRNQKP